MDQEKKIENAAILSGEELIQNYKLDLLFKIPIPK